MAFAMTLQIVIFIVGTVIIVFGAYYVTYYIGAKASGQNRTRLRNRSISLLDRFAISKDKSFCVIEIAGKVYIVGVTNQSMTLLDTLDSAQYAESAAERADTGARRASPGGGFVNRFFYYMSENMKKPRGKGAGRDTGNGDFSGIMRSAQENSEPWREYADGKREKDKGAAADTGDGAFADIIRSVREGDAQWHENEKPEMGEEDRG